MFGSSALQTLTPPPSHPPPPPPPQLPPPPPPPPPCRKVASERSLRQETEDLKWRLGESEERASLAEEDAEETQALLNAALRELEAKKAEVGLLIPFLTEIQ